MPLLTGKQHMPSSGKPPLSINYPTRSFNHHMFYLCSCHPPQPMFRPKGGSIRLHEAFIQTVMLRLTLLLLPPKKKMDQIR